MLQPTVDRVRKTADSSVPAAVELDPAGLGRHPAALEVDATGEIPDSHRHTLAGGGSYGWRRPLKSAVRPVSSSPTAFTVQQRRFSARRSRA
jgi:hypothetical protein